MPMLDPAMFDPATFMSPGMLAQMFGGGQAAPALPPPVNVPPPPGGIPPGPMSSGDGGALMPVPQPSPATPDMAALSGAYGSDRPPPKTDVPETSLLGRIGGKIDDFLKNNRSTLMALGAGMAGSQSLGQGLSRGMQMALPAQQQDIAQQKQNQTVSALIKRGLPPDVAQAAVNNPAILQQLLPQLFGTKQRKFTQIGEDFMGNKQFGFVDEVSGRTYGIDGREIGTGDKGGGGLTIPNGPDGQPLQGQDLLAHLKKTEPVAAAGVESIIRGDVNAGGRNLQKLLPLAALVDPSLHQFDYATRAKTSQFYKTGPGGMEAKAANTAIEHANQLSQIDEKLGGVDIGGHYVNQAIQGAKGLYDSKFQDARREWDTKSETLATEVSKALNGGTPHVADKEHWRAILGAASTPTERKAAIRSVMQVLEGRKTAAEENYRQGMGSANAGFTFIDPRNQEKYDRLLNYGHEAPAAAGGAPAGAAAAASPAAAAPVTATNPKTGVKVRLEGDRWVPVQ